MSKFNTMIIVLLFAFLVIATNGQDKPCQQRKYNHNSFVCVCNASYCDEVSKVVPMLPGNYVMYSSSMNGLRFSKSVGTPDEFFTWLFTLFSFTAKATIEINREQTYQPIIGFGGSFTDSAGININFLSEGARDNFIKSHFGENGLEYNVGRVPIGGSDFSVHPYAYNMQPENDITLSHFSLTYEDYKLKIPLIKKAAQVATNELLLIGSAWSPPIWMKNNHQIGGGSRLLTEYYQTWADYHLKFLQEYKKNEIHFWAITTGNEPSHGATPLPPTFNSLGWMPPEQATWIAENLGPTIRNSSFSQVKILALDDQRYSLPWWIEWMAGNKDAMQYIDGISIHWYWNDLFGPSALDRTHDTFPDMFLIGTEAATNHRLLDFEKVQLGSWSKAEEYMHNIIEDLNHWITGWVDWNLALDRRGGPNWFGNFVGASVIVVPEDDEFLKQPLFYAMGHFSKFLPRGSKRVEVRQLYGFMEHVAFLRPDNGIAVIFYNRYNDDWYFTIEEKGKGSITVKVPPRSFHSLIYW